MRGYYRQRFQSGFALGLIGLRIQTPAAKKAAESPSCFLALCEKIDSEGLNHDHAE